MTDSLRSESAWRIYRRFWAMRNRIEHFLVLASVGMVVEALSAGAFTALMKPMVNETFVARNPEVRWVLPLSILGLFVLRGIASFVTDYGMARTGRSVVLDLRQLVLSKFLRMPSADFDREPVPSLVSRLNYDTDQVAQASSDAIKIAITDTLTILVMLGVMLMQSVKVTMAVLVITPVIGLISSKVGKRYRNINRGIQDGVGRMAQAAEESLSAHQEVKIYGMQDGGAGALCRFGAQQPALASKGRVNPRRRIVIGADSGGLRLGGHSSGGRLRVDERAGCRPARSSP